MNKKQIIEIDKDKCTGCSKCVNACVGSALALVDGKAELTRQDYCDGLGVCIGKCPSGAITFKEVEPSTEDFHQASPAITPPKPANKTGSLPSCASSSCSTSANVGCPSTAAQSLKTDKNKLINGASALAAWPIQLHLIRPESQQFHNADILIAASCSAFSCGSFHQDILAGKSLIIACTKLDRLEGYNEKLKNLFRYNNPGSMTVARMEVPCCSGLTHMVKSARENSESQLEIKEIVINLQGEIIAEKII